MQTWSPSVRFTGYQEYNQKHLSISKWSPFDMTGEFPLCPINNLIWTINSWGAQKSPAETEGLRDWYLCWSPNHHGRQNFVEAKQFAPIIPGHEATPFCRCCPVLGLRGCGGLKGGVEVGLGRESTYGGEWKRTAGYLSAFAPTRRWEEIKAQ